MSLDYFYIKVLFIKIDLRGVLPIVLVFIKWEMWILLCLKNVAGRAVVAHNFDPNTPEAEPDRSL